MVTIESDNSIINITLNNFKYKSFYKQGDGIYYTIDLFLFHGKKTSNISIFNRINKIDSLYLRNDGEYHIFKDLKCINCYNNIDIEEEVKQKLQPYLNKIDLKCDLFKKHDDVGFYFISKNDNILFTEIKEKINIR